MSSGTERAWLPDLIYIGGKFEPGVAMFAGEDGRIARFSRNTEDFAAAHRLAGKAILPGLVNTHSHAFQRAIRGRTEHRTQSARDTFWSWREAMYHAANRLSPEDIYDLSRMAFLEMALSGITTVGEFHYLQHAPDGTRYEDPNLIAKAVVRAAHETGVRITLLRTAYARAGWKTDANPGQRRFITPEPDVFIDDTEQLCTFIRREYRADHVRAGIAPHSVRAVPLPYLVALSNYARTNALPVHMHVSEQPAEVEACLGEYGVRPVNLLYEQGILDRRFTAIHAIHLDDAEVAQLAAAGAHVCACPTTERNLGDGVVRADKLQSASVNICLGSDSNVQIDLLEDARELEYHLRMTRLERAVLANDCEHETLARELFASATTAGAQSLGAKAGALEPGCLADFFTVDINDPSVAGAGAEWLLSHIVFGAGRSAIRDTFVGGVPVVKDGRHELAADITTKFGTVQRRLWGL